MVGSLDKQGQKRPKKIVVLAIIYIGIAVWIAAIWGALHSFAAGSQNNSHLMLLVFFGAITVLTIAAPAGFLERQRMEKQERFPIANHPAPESENRRELLRMLDVEIKRSNRTKRPFALLRIQVDDLNRINNERGHLARERALRLFAEVLQSNCRELDTVVRYGSYEFAVLLAEADPDTLGNVSRRIRQRLASDRKAPFFPIRIGAAVFGTDGKSVDSLLDGADPEFYDMKRFADSEKSLCA